MPPYSKTILCLANSRRPGGKCVAGKEVLNGIIGPWIRPINPQQNNVIGAANLRLSGGGSAEVLDVLTVPMINPNPAGHQTENHAIDVSSSWTKVGRATWQDIVAATDNVNGPLWINGNSSFHGTNDKIALTALGGVNTSLMLIRPARLNLVVARESKFGGGTVRRVRANFNLNGAGYNFVVTDPFIESNFFAGPDGNYQIPESRLCISLAEVSNGIATKLVATVITPDRIG